MCANPRNIFCDERQMVFERKTNGTGKTALYTNLLTAITSRVATVKGSNHCKEFDYTQAGRIF